MTATDPTGLGLLLCDADERAPVLASGLPESALLGVPAPERGPPGKDSLHLEDLARDPNDLAAQRWAVIAPEGEAGDAALAAIRALVEHRRDQQGADPTIFRVPDGMDGAAALRWKHDVLRSEDVPADERPRYLLILGDIDRISLELQHVLANGSFVGRLHCPTLKGYRSYAEKVVTRERAAPVPRPRALYYTVQDGSAAIGAGSRHFAAPCMQMTADLAARGKLVVDGPTEIPHSEWGPEELFTVAGIDAPSLLVSLSHGLGAPRRGWRSPDQQRALQGALSLGSDEPLSADMVRESPFLPGGVWFCVACYGAGTPSASAFFPWLEQLARTGDAREQAAAVLRALPRAGERPFVAALPQALLANPSGPLAVIGHMDLAWTFGFTDPRGKQSRASRMHAAQRAIVGGSRVGVGLDALMHAYREVNDELMACYQSQRDAMARGRPDPVDPRGLGDAWMQRNDLRGYVLLGDPATRLSVAGGPTPRASEAAELRDRPRPASAPAIRTAASSADATPATAAPAVMAPPLPSADVTPTPVAAPPTVVSPDVAPMNAASEVVDPVATAARATAPPFTPTPIAEGRPATPAASPHAFAERTMTQPPPYGPPPGPEPVHHAGPAPIGAAPPGAITRPRTLENPEIGLRERAVLAMLRGDEAPRSIAMRFGLPLEEIFYWLDVYREAGRRALAG